MSILFHCTFPNEKEWLIEIKKKFKSEAIYTIKDKPNYKSIEYAIIWNLPNKYLVKLKNLKIIFSLGAGVDHILNLSSYAKTPIIRLKDPSMAKRMANHVLSQILNYQLKLTFFQKAQIKKQWLIERETSLNENMQVGILGVGFFGMLVGKYLKNLGYKIVGFKSSRLQIKKPFPIYTKDNLNEFIEGSDIIVNILPSTKKTYDFINSEFLKKMKKKSLLINVGRGSTINEKHLIQHLKSNKDFFASLDVFKKEPLDKSNLLWKIPNLTITPHIASLTVIGSAIRLMYKQYREFKKKGKIRSDVNLKKGY